MNKLFKFIHTLLSGGDIFRMIKFAGGLNFSLCVAMAVFSLSLSGGKIVTLIWFIWGLGCGILMPLGIYGGIKFRQKNKSFLSDMAYIFSIASLLLTFVVIKILLGQI